MPTSKTTAYERRVAAKQQRRLNLTVARALAASRVVLTRARAASKRALREGGNPSTAVRQQLLALNRLAVRALVNAHLVGMTNEVIRAQLITFQRRVQWIVPPSVSLAISANRLLEVSSDFLRRRAGLTFAELNALEQMYSPVAARLLTTLDERVDRQLQGVMAAIRTQDVSLRRGVQMLDDAFEALGIVPDNAFTLELIYRTQTQLALSVGQRSLEQDPAVAEILWGYKYVTAGDGRVRPEHAALEGVTLPKDDPAWEQIMPPNGYACRCQVIPIFEEREIVPVPDPFELDGEVITPGPDKGFDFNPGALVHLVRS